MPSCPLDWVIVIPGPDRESNPIYKKLRFYAGNASQKRLVSGLGK